MNTSMKNRFENKTIRALFTAAFKQNTDARYMRKYYMPWPVYYNDLRVTGRRRIFKTKQDVGVIHTWITVLQCLQDLGGGVTEWELWESAKTHEIGIMCREAR